MSLSEENAAEIQDLAWALADDAISAEEAKRLEDILLADPEARKLYVQCMQLQADLHLFFNPREPDLSFAAEAAKGSSSMAGTPVVKSLPGISGNQAAAKSL